MGYKVMVRINKCALFPEGVEVELESWQIDHYGERAYFQEGATIGSVTIPEDTVLVFDPPVVKDGTQTEAIAIDAVQGTWSLSHGIHRRSLTSRDSDYVRGFQSLEAVKKAYQRMQVNYASIGYECWFADAIPPGGAIKEKVQVGTPVPYW